MLFSAYQEPGHPGLGIRERVGIKAQAWTYLSLSGAAKPLLGSELPVDMSSTEEKSSGRTVHFVNLLLPFVSWPPPSQPPSQATNVKPYHRIKDSTSIRSGAKTI